MEPKQRSILDPLLGNRLDQVVDSEQQPGLVKIPCRQRAIVDLPEEDPPLRTMTSVPISARYHCPSSRDGVPPSGTSGQSAITPGRPIIGQSRSVWFADSTP